MVVEGSSTCLICYAEDLPSRRAISPCGHDDVCGICHLRLRALHADKKCPICKTENDRVIVDSDFVESREEVDQENEHGHKEEQVLVHKVFSEYEMWGDELGEGYTYRPDVSMFFLDSFHNTEVQPLFSLRCGQPNCDFTNEGDTYIDAHDPSKSKPNAKQKREKTRLGGMHALKEHLRMEHGLALCNLCVESKRDFISQLPRMTPSQLKAHLAKGDGTGSGLVGHPLCEFCRPKRFYDLTKLHEHLNKEHYKCFVCDKQGLHNQFFKNYPQLEVHFDREHFLCHDQQCLAARFVVFENEIDLRAHELSVHGATQGQTSTKIQLQFRVRRTGYDGSGYDGQEQDMPTEDDFQYGLDGQVFVPAELPQQQQQENEPVLSDPTHAMRTAQMRQQAARIRQEQQDREREEAFPSLEEGHVSSTGMSAGQNQPLVGWSATTSSAIGRAGRLGTNREEEFPSLGSTTTSSTTAAASALSARARGPVANRSLWAAASQKTPTTVTPAAPSAAAASSSMASWTSSSTSTPHTSATPSFARQSAPSMTSDNFPSLGAPSSSARSNNSAALGKIRAGKPASTPVRYAAADALAKSLAQSKKSAGSVNTNHAGSFPPLGGSTAVGKKPTGALGRTQKAPQLDSSTNFPSLGGGASDFPSLGGGGATKAKTAPSKKNKKNNNGGKTIRYSAAENLAKKLANNTTTSDESTLMAFSPVEPTAKEQLNDVKTLLGTESYKELKSLTKQFATDELLPKPYVDQVAALFDGGISNEVFQRFFPSLVQSCPDDDGGLRKDRALAYARRMKQQLQEEQKEEKEGNGVADLSARSFPSLGGGGGGTEFPTLGGGGGGGGVKTTVKTTAAAPGTKSRKNNKATRSRYAAAESLAKKLANNSTSAADSTLLEAFSPAEPTAKEQIGEIKVLLGSESYKELKSLTKQFATDELLPKAYVDQVAALFEGGASNVEFQNFIPNLIQSCPDDDGGLRQDRALAYARRLRQQHEAEREAAAREEKEGEDAADLSSPGNFPELGLGGGPAPTAPSVQTGGRPRGGKRTERAQYTAAEELAKKLSGNPTRPPSGKDLLNDIKVVLGTEKYKSLKNLTKLFASQGLSPESYVDRVVAMFDGGISDPDFVKHIPPLIQSCPEEDGGAQRKGSALAYVYTLQQSPTQNGGSNIEEDENDGGGGGGGPGGKWSAGGSSAVLAAGGEASSALPPPPGLSGPMAPPPGFRAAPPPPRPRPTGFGGTFASSAAKAPKSKWNGSAMAAPPASVMAAAARSKGKGGVGVSVAGAASEKQETGSATAFMAKERAKEKKLKQQQGQGGGKKKKKPKDDLKALAFGK